MSAIKLYTSKTDAFYFKDSQRNSFYEFGGIQLLPYHYYLQPYTYSDTITKVESFRLRDDVLLNDLSLYIQATVGYGIKFSQTTVMPYDYGNELIYLRFTYSGGYFYSNPFYYTVLDSDKTTYMAYRDNFVDDPYRISLKVWFRQKSRQSELTTYYETKNKNTVTQAIKSHDLDMYESEFMSMEDLIITTDILESPYLIINNLSSSLFEAVKLPELTQQENFGKIKFILNYGEPKIVIDGLELNSDPGIFSAYSLRKIKSSYSGNCIQVRRSSDSTTSEIGFIYGYLDTATLLTFIGSGDGFVKIFYDQTGSGRNFEMTTNSYQPKIVSSGSLITTNGKAAIRFSSSYMEVPSSNTSFNFLHNGTKNAITVVFESKSTTEGGLLSTALDSSTSTGLLITNFVVAGSSSAETICFVGISGQRAFRVYQPKTLNTQLLYSVFTDGSNAIPSNRINASLNNVYPTNNTNSNTPSLSNSTTNLRLGNISGYLLDGNVQEVIIWNEDRLNLKRNIDSEINNYYGIY